MSREGEAQPGMPHKVSLPASKLQPQRNGCGASWWHPCAARAARVAFDATAAAYDLQVAVSHVCWIASAPLLPPTHLLPFAVDRDLVLQVCLQAVDVLLGAGQLGNLCVHCCQHILQGLCLHLHLAQLALER